MTLSKSHSLSGLHFIYKMKRLLVSETHYMLTFGEEAGDHHEKPHRPDGKADSVLALTLTGLQHPHL